MTYPRIVIATAEPDFHCSKCTIGLDIETEFDGDEIYDSTCPSCNCPIKVKQEVVFEYTCIE